MLVSANAGMSFGVMHNASVLNISRFAARRTDERRTGYNRVVPPRYAFWTILIDHKPTAFRAREQAELLPTLAQLRRTNRDVILKWFSRGRLWDSPEQERDAQRRPPAVEQRTREWRPGGAHKDPRARFQKRAKGPRPPRTPKRGPRR